MQIVQFIRDTSVFLFIKKSIYWYKKRIKNIKESIQNTIILNTEVTSS